MLNGKMAMAMAAAMVLVALYGCSSNGAKNEAQDLAEMLQGQLDAANMSNTGLMNRIYGEGGTAEAPTADSLMGRLTASGTSNTGLMNQLYGEGGTAENPTADSLMGRLNAADTSNTGLMNRIYGEGGTAEAPTADSLMGAVDSVWHLQHRSDEPALR